MLNNQKEVVAIFYLW